MTGGSLRTFGGLRHFYVSVCDSTSIEICVLSAWLGHANVSITQSTYVHGFKRSHSDAMGKLDGSRLDAHCRSAESSSGAGGGATDNARCLLQRDPQSGSTSL